MNWNIVKLIMQIIASLVPIAEALFPGSGTGAQKKAAVVDQTTSLLATGMPQIAALLPTLLTTPVTTDGKDLVDIEAAKQFPPSTSTTTEAPVQ
jgi:hypothetical protein